MYTRIVIVYLYMYCRYRHTVQKQLYSTVHRYIYLHV